MRAMICVDEEKDVAMRLPENLYDFAFCHLSNYDYLAGFTAQENWGENNIILRNYFAHLYKRLARVHNAREVVGEGGAGEGGARQDGFGRDGSVKGGIREGGIRQGGQGGIGRDGTNRDSADPYLVMEDDLACFDTGLYTDRFESIYAYFVPNTREDASQEWYLKGFFKTSDPTLSDIDELPLRIRFFDDPADLVYDYRYKIRVNIDHILGDENNLRRIPEELQGPEKRMLLHRVFEGAVAEAERRVAANYMLAVPQYYNNRIQLLLPLCLTGDEPELALAIQREDGYYSARTCLTIDMAYNNARLVVRPETAWILP